LPEFIKEMLNAIFDCVSGFGELSYDTHNKNKIPISKDLINILLKKHGFNYRYRFQQLRKML